MELTPCNQTDNVNETFAASAPRPAPSQGGPNMSHHRPPRRQARHQPEQRPKRTPLPPPRGEAFMTGGVLDGLTVRLDHDQAAIRTTDGRYVRTAPDEWNWETDTMPHPITAADGLHQHPDGHAHIDALCDYPDASPRLYADPLPVQGADPDQWLPGDPCGSCGSTRTVLNVGPGVMVGACLDCGRSDDDDD